MSIGPYSESEIESTILSAMHTCSCSSYFWMVKDLAEQGYLPSKISITYQWQEMKGLSFRQPANEQILPSCY